MNVKWNMLLESCPAERDSVSGDALLETPCLSVYLPECYDSETAPAFDAKLTSFVANLQDLHS